jgi:hypothetical protein
VQLQDKFLEILSVRSAAATNAASAPHLASDRRLDPRPGTLSASAATADNPLGPFRAENLRRAYQALGIGSRRPFLESGDRRLGREEMLENDRKAAIDVVRCAPREGLHACP